MNKSGFLIPVWLLYYLSGMAAYGTGHSASEQDWVGVLVNFPLSVLFFWLALRADDKEQKT